MTSKMTLLRLSVQAFISSRRMNAMLTLAMLALLLVSAASFSAHPSSLTTKLRRETALCCPASSFSPRIGPLGISRDAKKTDKIMASLEREVMASTRARLDMKRVSTHLLGDDVVTPPETSFPDKSAQISSYYSPFTVAIAAGGVASTAVYFGVSNNLPLAAITWALVFLVANGDPLEEDSVAGALARVVGRATLRSVEVSQPKVRAVARAAVRGEDDLIKLQARIQQLESENASLLLWKQQRLFVDEALPRYSLGDLKAMARQNGLPMGGTKAQLLTRLVEAQVINVMS